MKKIIIYLLLSLLLLTACTNKTDEVVEETKVEENNGEEIMNKEDKILVVYFSRTGEQYRVGVIEKGNTEILAEIIAEKVNADLFEVEPLNDTYPMTYNELTDVAKKEQNENARPEYKKGIDVSEYDTIFIGAPCWWGDWPMIMYTFFENEDLSGKTLIPFNTHEGSGLSGFDRKLQSACKDSAVKEGLAIRGEDCQNNKNDVSNKVDNWLRDLGY